MIKEEVVDHQVETTVEKEITLTHLAEVQVEDK
jgi:hypothetical protein